MIRRRHKASSLLLSIFFFFVCGWYAYTETPVPESRAVSPRLHRTPSGRMRYEKEGVGTRAGQRSFIYEKETQQKPQKRDLKALGVEKT